MLLQKGSIEELFLALGYDWKEMEINKPIDVLSKKCFIKSLNLKTNSIELAQVTKIVRKNTSKAYSVSINNGETFLCSEDHLLLIHKDIPSWVSVKECAKESKEKGFLVAISGPKKKDITEIRVEELEKETDILDVEVENTHCYFSGGIISHNSFYGSPNVVSGGNSLKFYASQRLEVIRTGQEKDGDNVIGSNIKVKVIKNKVAPPYKEAEFIIIFGKGIDRSQEILNLAVEDNIIVKSGSWFKYGEQSIAQGKNSAVEWLNDNPEIREKIKETILENRGLN